MFFHIMLVVSIISWIILFIINKKFRLFIIILTGALISLGLLFHNIIIEGSLESPVYYNQIINNKLNKQYAKSLHEIEQFDINNKYYNKLKELKHNIYNQLLIENKWKINVVPDILSKYEIDNTITLQFDVDNKFYIYNSIGNTIHGTYSLITYDEFVDEEFINNGGENNVNNKVPFKYATNNNEKGEHITKDIYIKLEYESFNYNIINDKYLSYWDCVCKELYKNRYYRFHDDMYPMNYKLDEDFYKNDSNNRLSWLIPDNIYNSFKVNNEIWWGSYIK